MKPWMDCVPAKELDKMKVEVAALVRYIAAFFTISKHDLFYYEL